MNKTDLPQTIDEYIERFPPSVQEKLRLLRKTIKEAAPEASEKMATKCRRFICTAMGAFFHNP